MRWAGGGGGFAPPEKGSYNNIRTRYTQSYNCITNSTDKKGKLAFVIIGCCGNSEKMEGGGGSSSNCNRLLYV